MIPLLADALALRRANLLARRASPAGWADAIPDDENEVGMAMSAKPSMAATENRVVLESPRMVCESVGEEEDERGGENG